MSSVGQGSAEERSAAEAGDGAVVVVFGRVDEAHGAGVADDGRRQCQGGHCWLVCQYYEAKSH